MRVKLFICLVLQLCIVATWAKPHQIDVPTILSETATITLGSEWESYSEEEEGEVSIFNEVFI